MNPPEQRQAEACEPNDETDALLESLDLTVQVTEDALDVFEAARGGAFEQTSYPFPQVPEVAKVLLLPDSAFTAAGDTAIGVDDLAKSFLGSCQTSCSTASHLSPCLR